MARGTADTSLVKQGYSKTAYTPDTIEDFKRCADMIMIGTNPGSLMPPIYFIRYIPNILIPKKLKNFKSAIEGGDFLMAFQGRDDMGIDGPNLPDWRMAEIPSANGHGSAKSLAKLYGILSNGCQRDGVSIMQPEILARSITPYSSGPDTVLFGASLKFGLGFELERGISGLGNVSPIFKNKMFGHAGVGGAVAFGDTDACLGYAFVCNKQHKPRSLYQTNNKIVDQLYSII